MEAFIPPRDGLVFNRQESSKAKRSVDVGEEGATVIQDVAMVPKDNTGYNVYAVHNPGHPKHNGKESSLQQFITEHNEKQGISGKEQKQVLETEDEASEDVEEQGGSERRRRRR